MAKPKDRDFKIVIDSFLFIHEIVHKHTFLEFFILLCICFNAIFMGLIIIP